jgi:ribonuclease J
MELGMPEANIVVPDNGSIIEITHEGTKIVARKEKAPASPMIVDGFSVGDEQNVVIRDRQMLAEDGMFVVVAVLDSKTGLLRKSPDLISRGFVYLKENQELLRQTRVLVKRTIETTWKQVSHNDLDPLKNMVADTVSKYLLQKTAKRPLVIPVILVM